MKRDEPQPIIEKLNTSILGDLVQKARLLLSIEKALNAQLPPDFSDHCYVMNLKEQTLIIGVDNAAIATRIQFTSPSLITALNNTLPGKPICALRCRVRPRS